MSLSVETITMRNLPDDVRTAWLTLRAADPLLESPYHHPDYHKLVDVYQQGVNVSIARENGGIVGLLPWQGKSFARPSGAPFTDYQAIIGPMKDVERLLKGQSVGAFHYSAMPSPAGLQTARIEIDEPESWRDARDGSYRRHFKNVCRRIRKAEDEIGPRRIVTQSRDVDAYRTLMKWKSDKFNETGKYDVLASAANSSMVKHLWERGPQADLRADLQILYFGDRIAAADLGLTDGHVFHSWIVGYDAELHNLAPGIQLLEALIDRSPQLGYKVIDLGPSLSGYKRHYSSHSRTVSNGVITLPSPAGWFAAGYLRLETALSSRTGDALGKLRRRYSQIAACEPSLSGRSRAMWDAVRSQ